MNLSACGIEDEHVTAVSVKIVILDNTFMVHAPTHITFYPIDHGIHSENISISGSEVNISTTHIIPGYIMVYSNFPFMVSIFKKMVLVPMPFPTLGWLQWHVI